MSLSGWVGRESELIALVIAEDGNCRYTPEHTPIVCCVGYITNLEATVSMACHSLVVTIHAKV